MRTHLRLCQICIFMMEDFVYEERLSISLTVEFFSGHFRLPNNRLIIFRSTCLVFRWTILTATANIEQGRYMLKRSLRIGIYHITNSLSSLSSTRKYAGENAHRVVN